MWRARERGVDPSGYLRRLPLDRVVEVHLTTGDARAGAVEEHTGPVAGPVRDLFAELVATGPVRASDEQT
ncbi:multinuclear nonheme iron-dependent oxidase [Saccharothrix isguenensis]